MKKFEKIYAKILIGVLIIELIALIVLPAVSIIMYDDSSGCHLWGFAPLVALVIFVICKVMKSTDEEGGNSDG